MGMGTRLDVCAAHLLSAAAGPCLKNWDKIEETIHSFSLIRPLVPILSSFTGLEGSLQRLPLQHTYPDLALCINLNPDPVCWQIGPYYPSHSLPTLAHSPYVLSTIHLLRLA